MRSRFALLFGLAIAGLLLPSCGSDSPTSPPVAATPTPAPTPTATPTPSGAPFVRVTANIIGYTRDNVTYSGSLPFYIPADWIDVDCTPRDADGRSTPNHPAAIEWYYTSGGAGVLVDKVDYVVEDDNGFTFTPQVQIRFSSRSGYLDMWCKVGGIESNTVRIAVRGND